MEEYQMKEIKKRPRNLQWEQAGWNWIEKELSNMSCCNQYRTVRNTTVWITQKQKEMFPAMTVPHFWWATIINRAYLGKILCIPILPWPSTICLLGRIKFRCRAFMMMKITWTRILSIRHKSSNGFQKIYEK